VHLLIVEDDARLRRVMQRVLQQDSHVVELAGDGCEGLDLALTGTFDVVVLDLMLPKLDGFQVCKRLREAGIDTPVLMLTARDALSDRVRGLDAGADDYLAKPFAFSELAARLRALSRRRPLIASEVLSVGDLTLDPVRRCTFRGSREIELTPREFALLEYLMRHEGQALSRTQILDHVWGYGFDTMTNVVDTYIHYLRRKVDRQGANLLHTVRGVGYKIEERP
jgi:DNA-binding response OmpR family regulator